MKPSVYQWGRFLLWGADDEKQAMDGWPAGATTSQKILRPSSFFSKVSFDYLLAVDPAADVSCEAHSLKKLFSIARKTRAGLIYSDFLVKTSKGFAPHPLNDYQPGSIRDNFNFGHFFIFSAAAVTHAVKKYGALPLDPDNAFYDLRLKISIDYPLLHVPKALYTVSLQKPKPVKKTDKQREAQFAYVAGENAVRQKKLEKIATSYLKLIAAHLPPRTKTTSRETEDCQWKASIVIPVLNRKKTIGDALKSALEQKTDFPFNILVVDNHSTDGTTGFLKKYAAMYPHVYHLIPKQRNLGIGGCWNEAIASPFCGRYVVQLDSDDLYSSPHTLQKIINIFRRGQYAMVVGSYSLVNERLKPIPPGLIDHREWTQKNGHNNLLRVNGLGAPRAFDASVLSQFAFPNVSYGEDYAMALRISREYRIGRIYESLYLCRRWSDNTDAALSVEKQNSNDDYKDKLRTLEIKARQLINGGGQSCHPSMGSADAVSEPNNIFAEFPGKTGETLPALCYNFFESQKNSWPALASACRNLAFVRERELACGQYKITLQYNPTRAVSSGAAVDKESIKKRPCFLCAGNLPAQQSGLLYRNDYAILCNPAPIFHHHFTVVHLAHRPQEITSSLDALLQIASDASPDYTVFYNGPACGASAPDHLHFQMIPSDALPFLNELKKQPPLKKVSSVRIVAGNDFDRSIIVLESKNTKTLKEQFLYLLKCTQDILSTHEEPLFNILCVYRKNGWRLIVFFRRKHRPDAYFAGDNKRIFVSPGTIDMAGVVITPRLADFENLDCGAVRNIYREVSLDEETLDKIIWSLPQCPKKKSLSTVL